MIYEAFRVAVERAHVKWSQPGVAVRKHEFNSFEELAIGGAAGGIVRYTCVRVDLKTWKLRRTPS